MDCFALVARNDGESVQLSASAAIIPAKVKHQPDRPASAPGCCRNRIGLLLRSVTTCARSVIHAAPASLRRNRSPVPSMTPCAPAMPSSRLAAIRRARSTKCASASGGQISRAVCLEQLEPAVEMRGIDRQRQMLDHRRAVIAARHQRDRRPERAHLRKMRLPIPDAGLEDRPQHRDRRGPWRRSRAPGARSSPR